MHTPLDGEEHSLLTQLAPVEQLWPLTLRHVPLEATKPCPGGHAQALAAGSHPLVAAGHVHELAPADGVVEPPPHGVHGDLPALLKKPRAHEQPPPPSETDPPGHEETHVSAPVELVAAHRPDEQLAPPWHGWPAESRHAPVEPAEVSWVPAGHWQVLDARTHTEPVGCVQVHEILVVDVDPGGQAVHPGGEAVGLQKLGLHWQMPPQSVEPWGHALTQTPPLHSLLRHCKPAAHVPPSFFKHMLLSKTLPGSQTHALSVFDHVAPLPAGHEHADAPGAAVVEPPAQSTQGENPPGPNAPMVHWQVPEAVAVDWGEEHEDTQTLASTPVLGESFAHSPEAHCEPVEHSCPRTARHCPATSVVPEGQAHVSVSGSQANGAGQEHDVAPTPDVAPAGQAVQGGWPLELENVFAVHMQLPLASRADRAGHVATQTPDEHVPLAQSVPKAQAWLFLSKHVPLEETKPLFGSVQTHVLVAADHVAPLPTGQVQTCCAIPDDVDPPPQATQGVWPSNGLK